MLLTNGPKNIGIFKEVITMNENILVRKIFYRLEKSTFYPGRYLVLNDGNYVTHFYAGSDNEAIEKFNKGDY